MLDVVFPSSTPLTHSLQNFLDDELITLNAPKNVIPQTDDYCLLLTTKYVCRVPLTLKHELDTYTRKSLKPFLYQTPTLYNTCHKMTGLTTTTANNGKVFVQDNFGALYETSKER